LNLASAVFDTLNEYDIAAKLFCITTDNASNNFSMARELERMLEDIGVTWDRKTNHIPCLAHIINLVVQQFLTTLLGDHDTGVTFKTLFDKLRKIAKSIRGSSLRWEAFQRSCKSYGMQPMTIPLDITVRWNSTFRMLEQAIYLRRAIHRYAEDMEDDDPKLMDAKLTDNEWEQAEILLLFLLPFQRCTTRFECNDSQPEIDYVFFAYDTLYNHIDDVKSALNSNVGLGRLACAPYFLSSVERMEITLQKYYIRTQFPTVYGDGMILNPRSKTSLFHTATWDDDQLAKSYIDGARERFIDGYNRSAPIDAHKSTLSSIAVGGKRGAEDDDEFITMLTQRSAKRRRNDYDRYVDIPNDPTITSPLDWWRNNQANFPELSMMARDVLAVPASGCAVERQFSISGRIASWQRSRLSATTISDSMIYKGSLVRTPLDYVTVDDEEPLSIPEYIGEIPKEWTEKWWMDKLKRPIRADIMDLFRGGDGLHDEAGSDED